MVRAAHDRILVDTSFGWDLYSRSNPIEGSDQEQQVQGEDLCGAKT